MSRHRLHRLHDRQPQEILLHGGCQGATGGPRFPGPRLLHRLEPDPETLWREARPLVDRKGGVLVLDDSTLDKPDAKAMELVTRRWSSKHHDVVRGINLTTLPWTDGDRHIPCDYRLYDKDNDGLTKNDHFRFFARNPPLSGDFHSIASFTPDHTEFQIHVEHPLTS